jgi:hypothetical protein
MRANASAKRGLPMCFTASGSGSSVLVVASQIDQARAAARRTRRSRPVRRR